MDQRRAGLIQFKSNGEIYDAKGAFDYNLGNSKREAIMGSDGVHGYKEVPQVPFIEGAITDRGNLDVSKLTSMKGATVTLDLANGKLITLNEAWFAGDGNVNTEEAEIKVRFEGASADEVS